MTTDAERARLVARLRAHDKDTHKDSNLMKEWDIVRGMLLQGNRGDLPRQHFENIIDGIADDCVEAAALLEADGLAGETEREKVVAWLRRDAADPMLLPEADATRLLAAALTDIANAIERGDHLK